MAVDWFTLGTCNLDENLLKLFGNNYAAKKTAKILPEIAKNEKGHFYQTASDEMPYILANVD